ncbi:MAG: nodulation protein NfeD [Gammaproteobacteria bacterium]|nr:nodulation protein NfeD [Gammaproteobacteria bacterium]
MIRRICLALLATSIGLFALGQASTPAPGAVWVLKIDGAIGPATTDYLTRSFSKAQAADASLIVIEMNTPGGLDNAMRDIIRAILASPVPVATYVSPRGSRAASAGTYILYASHIAAMAPATNLGSATPVQIGAPGPASPAQTAPDDEEEDGEKASGPGKTAMEKKMINDAVAYIRGLAELYGRNADWAESAVRNAANISASKALATGVVDYIAKNLDDLISQVNGKTVKLQKADHQLNIPAGVIHHESPDWRTEILAVITDPNLVLILGMIGIYGVILEFYNPGAMVPGIVGVICLLVAAYSLQLLPVNYAGLALLVVGIGLMVAEAMAPSFGIMGIGGIIAFAIGGLILFDSDMEAFQVGIPALAAVTLVTAAFLMITIHLALKMRRQKVVTGIETILGQPGEALSDFDDRGMVRVGSEIWQAVTDTPLARGDSITVVSVDSLTLNVTATAKETG